MKRDTESVSLPSLTSHEGLRSDSETGSAFVIRGARAFDGERVHERADVLVRQGCIAAVAESVEIHAGVEIVDGGGKTLLPGLIDAHVHAWPDARRDALRFGVTTELDMFCDWRQLAEARAERESLAPSDRADLWSAGTPATARGGHATQFNLTLPTLSSPSEASDWVAARLQEGSDYIKIIREDRSVYGARPLPTLDSATAAAVIEAAHAAGRLAVVHVTVQQFARELLAAGADGLMHVFHDSSATAELVHFARDRGAFVVPTLTLIAGISGESDGVIDDAQLEPWLSAGQRQSLTKRPAARKPRPHLIANARESVCRLHAAGVRILAGTDAPNPGTAHGASLHEELRQLVKAGLTARQALAAATAHVADAFGLADRGRIAAGKRADLVLVAGDPTRDVSVTREIVAVWKNGRRVGRAAPTGEAHCRADDAGRSAG